MCSEIGNVLETRRIFSSFPSLRDERVEVARPLLAERALHVGVLDDRHRGVGRALGGRPLEPDHRPPLLGEAPTPVPRAADEEERPVPGGDEGRDVVRAVAGLVLDLQPLERAPVERGVEGDLEPAPQERREELAEACRGRTRPTIGFGAFRRASSTKTSPTRAVFPVSSARTKAWSLARSSTVNFFEAR